MPEEFEFFNLRRQPPDSGGSATSENRVLATLRETCGGFFSGDRFKKHEIDHRFGGHFRIFYCVSGHLNGHFVGVFIRSPLKNPPLGTVLYCQKPL